MGQKIKKSKNIEIIKLLLFLNIIIIKLSLLLFVNFQNFIKKKSLKDKNLKRFEFGKN